MNAVVEKKISNLIEFQFPQFYREEGPVFIQFVKAYYEWLEEQDNIIHRSRRIFEYRDIDETLEQFLYYFQKQYLYGIPFDVIINKRYLLKHVLDVYRSKGSIQCYKLLFRLIYNQDIDIYLPGKDVLRVSDGEWKEPRYLEVTTNNTQTCVCPGLSNLVGKVIIGLSSRTKATVESYVQQKLSSGIVSILYISNILPKNASFKQGEKIVLDTEADADNLADIISRSPTVLGSMDSLEIVNGGSEFKVGDVLKLVRVDPFTKEIISFGSEGIVRVSNTARGRGSIAFSIINPGSGYLVNDTDAFIYRALVDTTGQDAAFTVTQWSDIQNVSYNTDILAPYIDLPINSTEYGFPAAPTANSANTIAECLTFVANNFGSILTLGDINTGNGYTEPVDTFIRSTIQSNNMPGTISYNSGSANITGTSTEFTRYFANGDQIWIQANTSLADTVEKHMIRTVVNNTIITLYGTPTNNSTASAAYRVSPSIFSSNFASYEPIMIQTDQSTPGLNANVFGSTVSGNGVIASVSAINSGIGYLDGELVTAYLFGSLETPTIIDGGTGYSNGDLLIFAGGDPIKIASGYISTNTSGGISSLNFTYSGAGYTSTPTITVKTKNGSGAVIKTTVKEFNTGYKVQGKVKKGGVGRAKGRFLSNRGFLNSDKYIHDSFFYQDFSYQIKVANALSKYKEILYETFHTAGAELFGQYLLITEVKAPISILYEQTEATIS